MSPSDIDQVKQPERRSDNDVYSADFKSLMRVCFTNRVRAKEISWQKYEIEGEPPVILPVREWTNDENRKTATAKTT